MCRKCFLEGMIGGSLRTGLLNIIFGKYLESESLSKVDFFVYIDS